MLDKVRLNNKVQVTFTLPALSDDKSVCLVGDFNNWNPEQTPMQRTKAGYWVVTLLFEPNREYEYRYLVNGLEWRNDPDADGYVRNIYQAYNSLVLTTVEASLPASRQEPEMPAVSKPTPTTETTTACKRILLPFTDLELLEQTLARVLPVIQTMSGELVLLRVRPLPAMAGTMEDEALYTELKGIQAQLQAQVITTTIDTVVGPVTRAVASYAAQNAIDFVVTPTSGKLVFSNQFPAFSRLRAERGPTDDRILNTPY